jgi:hypothetical protein
MNALNHHGGRSVTKVYFAGRLSLDIGWIFLVALARILLKVLFGLLPIA